MTRQERKILESLFFCRSSLSVGFNSTSVVILEDFIIGCFRMKLSDRSSTIFVKILVVFFGLLAFSFLFLIEKLGGVLSVSMFRFWGILISCNLFWNFKNLIVIFNSNLGDKQFGRHRCRHFFWRFHFGDFISMGKFQGTKWEM